MPGERIYGPYPDRGRWRVVAVDAAGRRVIETFASEVEALEYRETAEEQLNGRVVQTAIDDHLVAMTRRGCNSDSVATTRWRLEGLHAGALADPLSTLTAKRAGQLYETYTTGRAPDTHRNALNEARSAGRLWVRQGWLATNPWLDVEAVGRRRRRKRQLKMDQTRALLDVAIARADTDNGALAVATMLLLGLRSSELCRIVAPDFDCGGTVVLIPEAKSEAGVRELEIPAVLQSLLKVRAVRSNRLFPHRRWWVREQVVRLCNLAGLEPVTAHALRGMHATVAVRRGVSAHAVAAALGHSSPKVTANHYIALGTVRDFSPGFPEPPTS
jgi:integrase